MRFPRSRRRDNPDERILPLTNVVFLLLIFFMLVGRLATPEPFQINPPESASETPVQARGLLVQIAPDGGLALDGETMPADALKNRVVASLRESGDAPVRLKADGAVPATRVVSVMHLLREAGVDNLRLVTVEPERRAASDAG